MVVGNAGGGDGRLGGGGVKNGKEDWESCSKKLALKLHLFMGINSKNFALSAATLYVREKVNINMKSYILSLAEVL